MNDGKNNSLLVTGHGKNVVFDEAWAVILVQLLEVCRAARTPRVWKRNNCLFRSVCKVKYIFLKRDSLKCRNWSADVTTNCEASSLVFRPNKTSERSLTLPVTQRVYSARGDCY